MADITPLHDEIYYRRRCAELEGRLAKVKTENKELREENAKMREKLLALKTTVSTVVARSIDAKADTGKKRYKRKAGEEERA
ncbi:MAG: hypothetical protein QW837_06040 [Conexivisphaerales archaeon]